MAVYLVNVYSPSEKFIKNHPGLTIHQEEVEDLEEKPDYFGKIYIKVENEKVTANELKTNDPIPILIKADQEDIYFPQPKDASNVKDAIETYTMCLYVLDRDIKPENMVNENQIPEEELSPKNYLYYKLVDIKEENEGVNKEKEQINKKVKTLTKTNNKKV